MYNIFMILINFFKQFMYGSDKRKIFLHGFFISYLFVMTLAALIDYQIQNYTDAYIELFFIIMTLFSLTHYLTTKNITIAIYTIVLISTLTTYALLISNSFNISVFHIIVPLGYFLLFSLKHSLIITMIHQAVVIGIYTYGYHYYPDNTHLHDKAILAAIIMASLIVILFGVVYHLAVENSYRQLADSNRQKELLLKEIHHRVKNNLNIISSLLGLQQLDEKNPETKRLIIANRLRIDTIAIVHEILYKHNNFEKIDFHDYMEKLSSTIFEMYDSDAKVIIESDHIVLPFEQMLKFGIITNELIINSIKYALTDTDNEIKITFTQTDTSYCYHYEDSSTEKINPEKLEQTQSLGTDLINMMVEQMDGTLALTTNNGLVYKIEVPR